MGWTNVIPTKPGFYYWQGIRLTGNQVAVVQVSEYKDKSRPLLAQELCVGGYKNAPVDGPAENWGGRWSGPLPQPDGIRS
jgi:hypothetical protein